MRVAGLVFADFEETFLGGASQVDALLNGQTILQRTLERLLHVEGLERRILCVRKRDEAAAAAALSQTGLLSRVELWAGDPGARPRRGLLRSARRWNLDAWRGSLLGTTWFDEFVEPLAVAHALDHTGADAALCVDGHQPVLDPMIASGMIAHAREHQAHARLVFTQAPPGLAGVVLSREVVRDLLTTDRPVGLTLSYRPETPATDPITRKPCFRIDPAVAQTAARLTGDTRQSRELLSAALRELPAPSAESLCAWLAEHGPAHAAPLPREVELELTTDTPLPRSRLRPPIRESRSMASLEAIERLAGELGQVDDRLVVLAGHGDPLRSPHFGAVCRILRSSGVCGLGVETTLVELSDAQIEEMVAAQVDVVEVRLDANSPATYQTLHGVAGFEQALRNIDRLMQARRAAASPQPLIIPSITRCAANLDEIDAFYDRWIRATGGALIRGHNAYGGALAADGLISATPLVRKPCRRLDSRMMLLADGRAALCHQDFNGDASIGSWLTTSLAGLWRGQQLQRLRAAHCAGEWNALPFCQPCGEWHRP